MVRGREQAMKLLVRIADFGLSVVIVLLSRWLLEVGSFRDDMSMLMLYYRIWHIDRFIHFLRWYSGGNYIHQMRARKILDY